MTVILRDWFGWPDGAVLTNLVAAAIGVVAGYLVALRHFTCDRSWRCFRPGRVPVKGTVHHFCKRHARAAGHTH